MVSRETHLGPLSAEEWRIITLFRERVLDLMESQKKYQRPPMYSYSKSLDTRVDSFQANTPDIDYIIILATKFRFFYADKEPTHFQTVANLLRNKAKDEWARNYIDRLKLWYKVSMNSTDTTKRFGHPVTNREILNLWFNSRFFHSDASKRSKLDDIHQIVGERVSLFQLYLAIAECSTNIRNLYYIVHKLQEDSLCICTPNHHFRLSKSSTNEVIPDASS